MTNSSNSDLDVNDIDSSKLETVEYLIIQLYIVLNFFCMHNVSEYYFFGLL